MKSIHKSGSSPGQVLWANKSLRYLLMGLAIFLLGLHLYQQYQTKKRAELAYAQTRQALLVLSENLNKGLGKAKYLNHLEIAKRKIYNY